MLTLPLDSNFLHQIAAECGITDIDRAGIRQLRRLVDRLETATGLAFVRMEMGIPGLPPPDSAIQGEIRSLQRGIGAVYPPFEGIPALKSEIARFIGRFINVPVAAANCYPTLGAMQGCYLGMALAARRRPGHNKILFLDPGFPVNKLQARALGLPYAAFDLAEHRGDRLAARLAAILKAGGFAAILYANPSNPAWLCLAPGELEAIARAGRRHDLVILEDLAYFGMDFREDYSRPGKPPFVPSIAQYYDRYMLIVSSSKVFSLAGQRIGMLAVSDSLADERCAHLKEYYPSDRFGEALAYGGLYAIGAGISHSAQFGLLALLKTVNSGQYDFLAPVRVYGRRAARLKQVFRSQGFHLVYDRDGARDLADGFYFTVAYPGMGGGDLVATLLRCGISAMSLRAAGSDRDGIRACVSRITSEDIVQVEHRLGLFKRLSPSAGGAGAVHGG
jgi:aspartate/methionine/tyrosine aminotransferase